MPQTAETFGHDADGNLTNDGRWILVWDGENRLLSMTANSAAPSAAKLQIGFGYDHRGRRVSKAVSNWNGSAYVGLSTNKFVYDDWNLLSELDHTNALARSYCWGLDLSGSLQGAGGVGGLITINIVTNGVQFVGMDGNGNVTSLVNATNGVVWARYEYGPFGELIRASGNACQANPCRFSTKYQDDESDAVYYGYRSYNSTTGKWLNRDPKEEEGNLYVFALNCPMYWVDPDGRALWSPSPPRPSLPRPTPVAPANPPANPPGRGPGCWEVCWRLEGYKDETVVNKPCVRHCNYKSVYSGEFFTTRTVNIRCTQECDKVIWCWQRLGPPSGGGIRG